MPAAAEPPCCAQLCATCSVVKCPTIEGLLILVSGACSFALIVAGVLLRVLNTQGMPTGKNAPPINGWQRFKVTSHQMQPASIRTESRHCCQSRIVHCSLPFLALRCMHVPLSSCQGGAPEDTASLCTCTPQHFSVAKPCCSFEVQGWSNASTTCIAFLSDTEGKGAGSIADRNLFLHCHA